MAETKSIAEKVQLATVNKMEAEKKELATKYASQ